MDGDGHNLGGALSENAEEPVARNTSCGATNISEEAWAAEWIEALLAREGVTIMPEAKKHMVRRHLSGFGSGHGTHPRPVGAATLQRPETAASALLPRRSLWMTDGRGIRVARRSRRARVRDGRPHWQGRRRPFLRISSTALKAGSTDGRLSSYIDEGWLALDDTSFAQPLREWLKTLRRKNASVIFATQSLADIETSAIAPALVESCPTKIFLPNERAIEQQITPSIGGSD
jgi:hypothetical protein